jgi:hypothetical protein
MYFTGADPAIVYLAPSLNWLGIDGLAPGVTRVIASRSRYTPDTLVITVVPVQPPPPPPPPADCPAGYVQSPSDPSVCVPLEGTIRFPVDSLTLVVGALASVVADLVRYDGAVPPPEQSSLGFYWSPAQVVAVTSTGPNSINVQGVAPGEARIIARHVLYTPDTLYVTVVPAPAPVVLAAAP